MTATNMLKWLEWHNSMTLEQQAEQAIENECWDATVKSYEADEDDLPFGPFSMLDTLACLGMVAHE